MHSYAFCEFICVFVHPFYVPACAYTSVPVIVCVCTSFRVRVWCAFLLRCRVKLHECECFSV